MNAIALMLAVTACYTITSLSDKQAARDGLSSYEFTFLMCATMSVFLSFTLPFQTLRFNFCPQSFIGIVLVSICKLTEFGTSVLVLRQISAFELKAWLGITLFISYITDVILGSNISIAKIFCIVITALGLIMIVRSERPEKANYKKIIIPLIFYLLSKYGYGLVIRIFTDYASSVCILLPALILTALITLTKVRLSVYSENKKATLNVTLARIPNAAGMLIENALIAISLASYSLIQPLIFVSLFIISFIRHEYGSKFNLIGGIICMAGAFGFNAL